MIENDRILKINIENEMKTAYIDYSMSVIVSRALPDVRDGFKPVHRRVLFGMNEMGNTSSHPHKKSANCVGEVMGKYHPHGDSSIYGTVVRMAQPWSLRYPLVDGHGNFGSIDGDGPAAMRYTEVRLEKIGEEMLRDIDSDTVDFQPNYDNSRREPVVLPTRFPNLLVNGADGIAVGMATNIPPHNLSEVIDGTIAMIDNPEIKDTVKSVTAVESELKVIPGTSLDAVKAALPASVSYTTMKGATGEIALSWESADWAEMTAGTYTFTAATSVALDDVFDVIPERYSVSVIVEKADTTELDALIAEVEALNSETYTVKTWSPLATLVAEAKEAIAVITVTEETVAGYVESITAAKAALQELATDKSALAAAVATAGAIDNANYMSATVEGLDEALAAATAVNSDMDASVAETTAALNALNEVLNGLVEKGDTTALAALVDEITAANYVEENYTEMSYATLVDALAEAEEIVAAAETPKTEVEAAYTALENAKNGLVAYGDTTELATLISECEALVEADYTAGSWSALTAEVGEASALVGEKVMQDVVDVAKAELQAAKDGLVSVVALKAAIASTIDETAYTAISVQVWKDAKVEAQLVLENADATVEEVAAAVAAIEAAEDALVEIPADDTSDDTSNDSSDVNSNETSDTNTGSENNQNSSASSGCSGTLGVASVALTLIGAAAVVALKKKED